jgi:hypothetical protein
MKLAVKKIDTGAFLLAMTVFIQNPVYIFWRNGIQIVGLLALLLVCYLYMKRRLFDFRFPNFVVVILLLLIFVFIINQYEFGLQVSTIMLLVVYWCMFLYTDFEKNKAIDYISNILAVILSLSLPLWLVHVFISPLPLHGTISTEGLKPYPFVNNYIFFITVPNKTEIFRFYSVFDEPGVLGTLGAFVLFINKYDFRKIRNVIILLGCLFTFSMAFYVLILVGIFYYAITSLKRFIFLSLILLIIGYGVFFFLKDFHTFNIIILSRFNTFGMGLVESRTGMELNRFFSEYVKSPQFFRGMGNNFLVKHNLNQGASYKQFLIQYGLCGAMMLLFMYISLLMRKKNPNIAFLLILFILSFLQRPVAFTPWQVILFSCGVSRLRYSSLKNI